LEAIAMVLWKKLSVYTSEGTRSGIRPLHTALVATALEEGLCSAIAIKAMEGFGPQMAIPTPNGMALESDLPVEVQIFGEPEAIDQFLAEHRDLLSGCFIVVADVAVFYSP
jgi:PII-like signaling protein